MYNTILMSDDCTKQKSYVNTESFNIDINFNDTIINESDSFFAEAVFSNGKSSLKPIENQLKIVRDILLEEIKLQDKNTDSDDDSKKQKKFNPTKFWKHQEFKKLENIIQEIFGFRSVQIFPYIEKYISKDKEFESREINCVTYTWDRYPIDGLVTDKGFYDNTHSITLDIRMSLGLLKMLEPDELIAVILHELGHNIDPALISISYTEVNILSKYLTDRNSELSNVEKKLLKQKKLLTGGSMSIMIIVLLAITSVVSGIVSAIKMLFNFGKNKSKKNIDIMNKKLFDKLKESIEKEVKTEFNRRNFSEAFADNFARMYGYGSQLTISFKKMSKYNESKINSRYKKEKDRQRCIMYIVSESIKNVHKTDIHRIKALIRSYYEDINDPNTPKEVKKQLQDDVKEVELVLDSYLKDFSDFQNNINKIINDEIDKNSPINKSDDGNNKEKEIKESITFFENRKAYENLIERKNTLTSSERSEVKKIFGNSTKCSFAKDKNGYYCYTHRCRSKSYPSISDIPKKDVEFVRSTS